MNPESAQMKIGLPPAFTAACDALEISPQAALQQYIDHLSVYVHFTAPDEAPHSMASTLFKTFIENRSYTPPPGGAERELHVRCIRQLLQLIQGRMNPKQKKKQYLQLVNEWYTALTQNPQP